ncbi:MAG: tRNA uridine-5-carboxymethylaminomethyl(34) synthesis GTPase MnmE [Chromatiales bacterium]|nr:tRNA uridine-5-carboxymethylaminomethyl(34) synthesis GTPase MnmE [Chromatiales bacterium]
MNLKDGDTIAAIASATGKAGIGVVRISGVAASEIATKITKTILQTRTAHYSRFVDEHNQVIDEGIAILYKAPASFTGEDVLELQAHGSPIVLDLILERVLQLGARLAQPGEFSQRAFLNHKYDLVQLEAIADLINSSSREAARGAQRALQGEMSHLFSQIAERIKTFRVRIEAELDFSDEDIDILSLPEFEKNLTDLIHDIEQLKKKAQHSLYLYEGIKVVIVGRVNVGKSSLLNRLTNRAEAIVNAQPGTTRDIVNSNIAVDGIPLTISDTAGLRETNDVIEQEGMRRTRNAVQASDLLLLLVDARDGICATARALLSQCKAKPTLIVANKIDLLKAPTENAAFDVQISAKTGAGIDLLKQQIKARITHGNFLDSERSVVFANRRHIEALHTVAQLLSEITKHPRCQSTQQLELVAENFRLAQQALADITGTYGNEELLSDIFSRFCIGK